MSLRGGVIGAGVFGGYHARQYAQLPGALFCGVYDTHPDRAAKVAMPLGGRAFASLEDLLAEVDVVTVASPATRHADQALAAIAAGKHVYVEKPIAVGVADAERVARAAERAGVIVACGHQSGSSSRPWACWTSPSSRCCWRPCAMDRRRTAAATSRPSWT
jgi:predicted dehydrogenase